MGGKIMKYAHIIIGVPDEQEPRQVALELLADFDSNNEVERLGQIYARIVDVNNTETQTLYIAQDGNFGDGHDLCFVDTSLWSDEDWQALETIGLSDTSLADLGLSINADPSCTPSKFLQEEN
jgi:hypothetical protein